MRREPRPRLRLALAMGLQGIGVLGTSHCLNALIRLVPGYDASRIAQSHAVAGGAEGAGLLAIAMRDVLLPATFEELLFRGLVFGGLQRMLGTTPAIIGSAALFGLAHLDVHQAVVAALIGLQLGALRARFGLALAIATHAANNAAALLAGAVGFEATAGTLAVAMLLSGSAWAALVQRPGPGGQANATARGGWDVLQRGSRSDESA